jgi:aryl-alcohol dehydrogenase-like predicted oxidoreductase
MYEIADLILAGTKSTADVYSNGESERILGKAIKQFGFPREGIVVLTKV